MDLTRITPDTTALRALAHPMRMRILGLLRSDGPSTATALAAQLGLNSGATSYHLRQLAQHGFVEDDPDNGKGQGNGRDRWWRAAHQSTSYQEKPDASLEEREASDAFGQAIAIVHTEQLQHAIEERSFLPAEWRRASTMSDWGIRLTPEHAYDLVHAIEQLVESWEEDGEDVEGTEQFMVVLDAYPRPGQIAPADPS